MWVKYQEMLKKVYIQETEKTQLVLCKTRLLVACILGDNNKSLF